MKLQRQTKRGFALGRAKTDLQEPRKKSGERAGRINPHIRSIVSRAGEKSGADM